MGNWAPRGRTVQTLNNLKTTSNNIELLMSGKTKCSENSSGCRRTVGGVSSIKPQTSSINNQSSKFINHHLA